MIRIACLVAALLATPALATPMTVWNVKKDGDPKVYSLQGLSLTLATAKDKDKNTLPAMTIRAPGAAPFVIRGEPGFEDTTASFAVGRFDPKAPAPQVFFTSFTGGAHCCNRILLAERAGAGWKTVDLGLWDGDGPLDVPADIDGDGVADFEFVDNDFLYAFDSYAASRAPPKILNVVGGKMSDVSTAPRYRKVFVEDMARAKAECAKKSNGACAGYVASATRAGHFDEAWAFMLAHYDADAGWDYPTCCIGVIQNYKCAGREIKPNSFLQSLRWFLEDHRYIAAGH